MGIDVKSPFIHSISIAPLQVHFYSILASMVCIQGTLVGMATILEGCTFIAPGKWAAF